MGAALAAYCTKDPEFTVQLAKQFGKSFEQSWP